VDATFGILQPLLAEMCGLFSVVFCQSALDKSLVYYGGGVVSHHEFLLASSWRRVGRGNKFVLLDITEEPEAKKLTVYNTNEI
jgi:hypothetical protein